MRPIIAGRFEVAGIMVTAGKVRKSIKAGVAHIPEDRLHTGLAASHSVEDNLVLKSYRHKPVSKFSVIQRKIIRRQALEQIDRYDVKTPDSATPVRLLSGGNVQKVLLAREFSADPRVLVAASPTRGLDVGAIEGVRKRIVEAADHGVGVLIISEDLEELLSMSDRILVMYEGRIIGDVPTTQATRESIGLLMGGIVATSIGIAGIVTANIGTAASQL